MGARTTLLERLRRGHHGVVGAVVFAAALPLALLGVEPFPVYWYLFAWFPLLLVLDALAMRKRGWSLLVDRPLAFGSLLGWSVPFWLFFEALNLRLENWYYVDAPADLLAGRLFLVAAFATVLPGIVLAYDLLGAYGAFERLRTRPFRTSPEARRGMVAAGALSLVLPLLFPVVFFPLVWGALALLLEPFDRWPRRPSILRDLERGRPARLCRLLAAGAFCGLFWELMNLPARTRWIYTVPGLDRLFTEMPPLGFLGFLPFALAAYAFLRFVERLGLSVPFEPDADGPVAVRVPAPVRLLVLPVVVAGLSMLAVLGLEARTVDSRDPLVKDLPSAGVRESAALALEGLAGVAAFLEATDTAEEREALAAWLLVSEDRLDRVVEEARLAAHRGIGTRHLAALAAVGVRSVETLARSDPERLLAALRERGLDGSIRPRRLRLWVRAARG